MGHPAAICAVIPSWPAAVPVPWLFPQQLRRPPAPSGARRGRLVGRCVQGGPAPCCCCSPCWPRKPGVARRRLQASPAARLAPRSSRLPHPLPHRLPPSTPAPSPPDPPCAPPPPLLRPAERQPAAYPIPSPVRSPTPSPAPEGGGVLAAGRAREPGAARLCLARALERRGGFGRVKGPLRRASPALDPPESTHSKFKRGTSWDLWPARGTTSSASC